MAFDGREFVGTAATTRAFSYLPGFGTEGEGLVDQNSVSWNRLADWLQTIVQLRQAC